MQLELTFGNDQVHLPSVRAFMNATLQELPLQSATVEQLGTFIETAVVDAILHAYPAGVQGLIKLSIQEQHGMLEIRVRDFGIPKDVQLMERQLQSIDPTATDRFETLAADVAGYLPTRDAWMELRKYATIQHLTIESSFVPEAWDQAVEQAQPGQLPPGATAVTIEGTRHREGVWNGDPVTSEHPVSFTVFLACPPPAPEFSSGLCHVLRLSQLDNPLR